MTQLWTVTDVRIQSVSELKSVVSQYIPDLIFLNLAQNLLSEMVDKVWYNAMVGGA